MRKYQQLLLIIISVISIISLVQYRNEYLRLRYVLQVLNFFGSPNNIIDNNCISLNESFVNSEANFYKYSDPSPLWFNFEKHYLYSAFWEIKDPDSGRKAVKILAVGEESSFRNYQCRIWFDEGNTVKSKDGEFTYQMVSRSSSSEVFYYLYCEAPPVTEFDGFPYGVLLTSDSGVKRFVPIFVQPHDTDTIVACVKPDLTALPKFSIVEFMIYYNIIGVQDFIVYDVGLQHTILHSIQALSGLEGFSRSVSILSWNFPFTDLELQDEVIRADCLARSSDKSTTLVLGWDEYLVPKSLTSLSGLIQGDTSTKYETKTLACCTEMNDDKAAEKTWPTSLRKTRCIPQTKRAVLYHHPNVRSPMQKEELPPASLSLHIYRTCDPEEKHVKLIYEPVMAKYLGKFIAHKLMALWNSGSLVRHHAVHLQALCQQTEDNADCAACKAGLKGVCNPGNSPTTCDNPRTKCYMYEWRTNAQGKRVWQPYSYPVNCNECYSKNKAARCNTQSRIRTCTYGSTIWFYNCKFNEECSWGTKHDPNSCPTV